jgi:RNA recognition motif-containing protein
VRLFVGNLSYATTEADLRAYFGAVAPPSQVVLPVDRETGRPRGFAFIEYTDRSHAEQAIQRFNGQIFNGRPLAVSEARAREDRGPGGPRPGGFTPGPRPGGFAPRPPSFGGPPRPFDPNAPVPARSRNFGPDAKPQRGGSAKAKKKESERPRGPIPLKSTGRSFTLDDDSPDEALPDIDDFATSKPAEKPVDAVDPGGPGDDDAGDDQE